MDTIATPSATVAAADAKVQHLTKKSSEELLNKFADESLQKKKLDLRVIKRQKKSRGMRREDQYDSPSNGGAAVMERRSLLPSAMARRSVLLRQLRAKDVRNKTLLGTILKRWRRNVEGGASRVLMEKHYHRHKRLINDMV